MTTYDGPTLRSVRESAGIPLRRVARQAGMSHGHLSKVERGEYGRPVTPAVMAAYEKVTGLKLADAVPATQAGKQPNGHGNKTAVWRPGQMSKPRRRGYNAAVAALTVGGHLGEPLLRLLDSTGRPVTPALPEGTDVAQLGQLTTLATTLDLRYGGRLAAQHAKALLRWAVPILHATGLDEQMNRRLHAAVARLAHRAAWAAFDTDAHDAARSLFRLAAHTATVAGDPDLRAHVVADVAAQHNHLGYHDAALEVIRFVEGDERINPLVQGVLQLVKARTFAALGDREGCYRCIKLAEQHHDDIDLCPGPDGGWLVSLCHAGLLHAGIGHALASLAVHTATVDGGDAKSATAEVSAEVRGACTQATERLTSAIGTLNDSGHARAHTLCLAQLAGLQLIAGKLDDVAHWTRLALRHAASIGSARLNRALAVVRDTTVERHPNEPTVQQLVDEIDAHTNQPVQPAVEDEPSDAPRPRPAPPSP